MCRITGIWQFNPQRSSMDNLLETCQNMRDTMHRGGPDNAGLFFDPESGIAMGHRRLSIIDLSDSGHQPMTTGDDRYTLCYNGEIYNYREIKKALEAKGCRFRGGSDAEVVLQAFAQWGPGCIDQFIGMFAFSVWDCTEKTLYLFRDRIGVKPLYYYKKAGFFAFASEVKALHCAFSRELTVNTQALGQFFQYGYISAPDTIYTDMFKLMPGTWMRVSSTGEIQSQIYWSIDRAVQAPVLTGSEDDIADALEALLIDAAGKRLIADVPVGIFLSGGIDSSLVTALLARHSAGDVKTFTIGFQEAGFDESQWARAIARYLGTEHTERIVSVNEGKKIVDQWGSLFDEPFGDISGLPTAILAEMTSDQVKVSLSADGGDELFWGYRLYERMSTLGAFLHRSPRPLTRMAGSFRHMIPGLKRCLPGTVNIDSIEKALACMAACSTSPDRTYQQAVSHWFPDQAAALTGNYVDIRDQVSLDQIPASLALWDIKYYLPDDIMVKVDRTCMFHGLEGREPLLDHRLVEFALSVPVALKHKGPKYLLKKILARYLPQKLFDRPKQGFGVPLAAWLKQGMAEKKEVYLSDDMLNAQTAIDPRVVKQTLARFHRSGGTLDANRIWLVVVWMMWQEQYGKS
jgi:asparagine synthase (glutamine-hydrolysing)